MNGKVGQEAVAPSNIEVIHTDDFFVNVIVFETERALTALCRHREALSKSTPTSGDYLAWFQRRGLIKTHHWPQGFAELLRSWRAAASGVKPHSGTSFLPRCYNRLGWAHPVRAGR